MKINLRYVSLLFLVVVTLYCCSKLKEGYENQEDLFPFTNSCDITFVLDTDGFTRNFNPVYSDALNVQGRQHFVARNCVNYLESEGEDSTTAKSRCMRTALDILYNIFLNDDNSTTLATSSQGNEATILTNCGVDVDDNSMPIMPPLPLMTRPRPTISGRLDDPDSIQQIPTLGGN